MRYEQPQKGLFTFYKEQEQFELKIERMKQRKIQEENQMQHAEINKKQGLAHQNNVFTNYSLENNKNQSRPAYNTESAQHLNNARNSKLKQIGNSVIIINRKNSESDDLIPSAREISYQERSKPTGHFIENKKIGFQQLEKYKISHPLMQHRKKKRSFLKKRQENYSECKNQERRSTKLPTLVRVEQNNNEDSIQHHLSLKSKPITSSLKYQGGNVMKYIRSSMKSQFQTSIQGRQSVSFIQYNKSYLKDSKSKKLDGLNEEQKKLLQVLCRYRNQIN